MVICVERRTFRSVKTPGRLWRLLGVQYEQSRCSTTSLCFSGAHSWQNMDFFRCLTRKGLRCFGCKFDGSMHFRSSLTIHFASFLLMFDLDSFESKLPRPILSCPPLNAVKVATGSSVSPTGDSSLAFWNGLQIGIGRTHQALAEIVDTVLNMARVSQMAMAFWNVNMLSVDGSEIDDPK